LGNVQNPFLNILNTTVQTTPEGSISVDEFTQSLEKGTIINFGYTTDDNKGIPSVFAGIDTYLKFAEAI
jgi:hypothetical protein